MKKTTYRIAYSYKRLDGRMGTGSIDIIFSGSPKVTEKTLLIFDSHIRNRLNDIAELLITGWSRIYD